MRGLITMEYPITYLRGDAQVLMNAATGGTVFEQRDDYGEVNSMDFMVATDALVLCGKPTLPERGDRIFANWNGKPWTYIVMAPGKEPHFRYCDPYKKRLRIHTQQLGPEGVPVSACCGVALRKNDARAWRCSQCGQEARD